MMAHMFTSQVGANGNSPLPSKKFGRTATGVRGDVSNAYDLDRLFAQIREERGRVDILFANAGIAKYAAL